MQTLNGIVLKQRLQAGKLPAVNRSVNHSCNKFIDRTGGCMVFGNGFLHAADKALPVGRPAANQVAKTLWALKPDRFPIGFDWIGHRATSELPAPKERLVSFIFRGSTASPS